MRWRFPGALLLAGNGTTAELGGRLWVLTSSHAAGHEPAITR